MEKLLSARKPSMRVMGDGAQSALHIMTASKFKSALKPRVPTQGGTVNGKTVGGLHHAARRPTGPGAVRDARSLQLSFESALGTSSSSSSSSSASSSNAVGSSSGAGSEQEADLQSILEGGQKPQAQVFLRIKSGPGDGVRVAEGHPNHVRLHDKSGAPIRKAEYSFDGVVGQDAGNPQVFETVGKPMVDGALQGLHGTIFAYGATGSGKTFAMLGSHDDPGIIPQAIAYIDKVEKESPGKVVTMRVSFVEVYNETVRDLLQKRTPELEICEEKKLAYVKAREVTISDPNQVLALLAEGDKRRAVGSNGVNKHSSRSHSIFRIIIESTQEGGSVTQATLNLVDLAGAEGVRNTKAKGQRLEEAKKINQSLLALGFVVTALATEQNHIPFRNSKLTRLLEASLTGSSQLALICCVCPSVDSLVQTRATLRFAATAKEIKVKPILNDAPVSDEEQELAEENRKLQDDNALLQEENAALQEELETSQQCYRDLQQKYSALFKEYSRLAELEKARVQKLQQDPLQGISTGSPASSAGAINASTGLGFADAAKHDTPGRAPAGANTTKTATPMTYGELMRLPKEARDLQLDRPENFLHKKRAEDEQQWQRDRNEEHWEMRFEAKPDDLLPQSYDAKELKLARKKLQLSDADPGVEDSSSTAKAVNSTAAGAAESATSGEAAVVLSCAAVVDGFRSDIDIMEDDNAGYGQYQYNDGYDGSSASAGRLSAAQANHGKKAPLRASSSSSSSSSAYDRPHDNKAGGQAVPAPASSSGGSLASAFSAAAAASLGALTTGSIPPALLAFLQQVAGRLDQMPTTSELRAIYNGAAAQPAAAPSSQRGRGPARQPSEGATGRGRSAINKKPRAAGLKRAGRKSEPQPPVLPDVAKAGPGTKVEIPKPLSREQLIDAAAAYFADKNAFASKILRQDEIDEENADRQLPFAVGNTIEEARETFSLIPAMSAEEVELHVAALETATTQVRDVEGKTGIRGAVVEGQLFAVLPLRHIVSLGWRVVNSEDQHAKGLFKRLSARYAEGSGDAVTGYFTEKWAGTDEADFANLLGVWGCRYTKLAKEKIISKLKASPDFQLFLTKHQEEKRLAEEQAKKEEEDRKKAENEQQEARTRLIRLREQVQARIIQLTTAEVSVQFSTGTEHLNCEQLIARFKTGSHAECKVIKEYPVIGKYFDIPSWKKHLRNNPEFFKDNLSLHIVKESGAAFVKIEDEKLRWAFLSELEAWLRDNPDPDAKDNGSDADPVLISDSESDEAADGDDEGDNSGGHSDSDDVTTKHGNRHGRRTASSSSAFSESDVSTVGGHKRKRRMVDEASTHSEPSSKRSRKSDDEGGVTVDEDDESGNDAAEKSTDSASDNSFLNAPAEALPLSEMQAQNEDDFLFTHQQQQPHQHQQSSSHADSDEASRDSSFVEDRFGRGCARSSSSSSSSSGSSASPAGAELANVASPAPKERPANADCGLYD